MSSTNHLASRPGARYLASPLASTASARICTGDTVDEMRLYLERGRPGRYRVFDRQPATRGIDAELVGEFIVDEDGRVHWEPLLPA
jgi:hypothetical protein